MASQNSRIDDNHNPGMLGVSGTLGTANPGTNDLVQVTVNPATGAIYVDTSTNAGALVAITAGTLQTLGTVGTVIGVGTLTNAGSLTNVGTIKEAGTVTGVGVVTSVTNLASGTLLSSGTTTGIGTITNIGSVTNVGTIKEAGTVTGVGVLTSVTNLASGTLLNSGTTTGVGVVTSVTNLVAGTLLNSGTTTGVGVVTTVTTVSNLTTGSVVQTAGTLTLGTLTNLVSGTINAIAAGTITAGTLTNLVSGTITRASNVGTLESGTIKINATPAGSILLSTHVLGTGGGTFFGTMVAPVGAGTSIYLAGLSIVVHSGGSVDCGIANNVAGTTSTGVYARGFFPVGGGIARDFNPVLQTGTNGTLAYFLITAGTASFTANYWVGP